jgi:hypothetical protein
MLKIMQIKTSWNATGVTDKVVVWKSNTTTEALRMLHGAESLKSTGGGT